jgi:hypothetical protein
MPESQGLSQQQENKTVMFFTNYVIPLTAITSLPEKKDAK